MPDPLKTRWTGGSLPTFLLLTILLVLLAGCAPRVTPTEVVQPLPATAVPVIVTTETPIPQPAPPTDIAAPAPETPPTTVPVTGLGSSRPGVRLAVIGDYGLAGEPEGRVAALVKGWQPDYVLTVGDNNYPDGAAATIDENIGQYYQEYIGSYQGDYGSGALENRFFPALGNHDLDSAQGQPYLDYFNLPGNERYYDVVLGPVHVFVLNSDSREPDGVGLSSTQAAWLRTALFASSAPWKLVISHAPPYSSGVHGSTDYMQWPFAEWGATAVLSGHDHVYERLQVNGIPYIINGLGGGPRYEFTEPLAESASRYREDYGALLVEADNVSIIFRFVNANGEEIDRYSLGNPQTSAPETVTPEATAADQASPNASSLPDPAGYTWQTYATGLLSPVGMAVAPGDSSRLFVLEQAGVIQVVQEGVVQPDAYLDLRDRVGANASEQGLLGLAFDPDFMENGRFYVDYTDTSGNTVISRFQASADRLSGDPSSEQRLLAIIQPYQNHNGGHIAFGPDGYLYVGMGDGGSAGDPQGNAQNLQTLLGKILRIDVDGGSPYAIPAGNPFSDSLDGLPEIFISGVRNPWKFDFDPATGDLYIADVGQNQWEEVNFLPAGAAAGSNLGWNYREGPLAFEGSPAAGIGICGPGCLVRSLPGLFGERRGSVPRHQPARVPGRVPVRRLLHRARVGAAERRRRRLADC